MTGRKVLFLCTGNSARSIIAEAILSTLGGNRFTACSAGSHPVGRVHPAALKTLEKHGLRSRGLASKSWDVFAGENAQAVDVVITVCDDAAGETCPAWPGRPLTAHWSIADPARVTGSPDAISEAFESAYRELDARVRKLLELPFDAMSREEIESALMGLA